jgi:hypothetical protein
MSRILNKPRKNSNIYGWNEGTNLRDEETQK